MGLIVYLLLSLSLGWGDLDALKSELYIYIHRDFQSVLKKGQKHPFDFWTLPSTILFNLMPLS